MNIEFSIGELQKSTKMDKLPFSELNGSNRQTWKFKMELSFIDKELWETIAEARSEEADAALLKRRKSQNTNRSNG